MVREFYKDGTLKADGIYFTIAGFSIEAGGSLVLGGGFDSPSVLSKFLGECEDLVLRPSGKQNYAHVKVLPLRGGRRVRCLGGGLPYKNDGGARRTY